MTLIMQLAVPSLCMPVSTHAAVLFSHAYAHSMYMSNMNTAYAIARVHILKS